MKGLRCWLLGSFLLLMLSHSDAMKCKRNMKRGPPEAKKHMKDVFNLLRGNNHRKALEEIECLERTLEATEVNETTSMTESGLVAVLHRPKGRFRGSTFDASETEASSERDVGNRKVRVRLPQELDPGSNTIVFCMFRWPRLNKTLLGISGDLYENRMIGVSVQNKKISGLKERVNITLSLNKSQNAGEVQCVFLNFSTKTLSSDGCETVLEPGESNVTCSCDHLTYFGVLMVTPQLSDTNAEILSYITLIGCSISLAGLILAILIFITNRKVRADVSMKVHVHLAVALILLNLHFLPSNKVATLSSSGPCIYVAVALHYSLLATFSWMALEGFHLYLLLVKVFNIYVRRYLLKLSLVGWGFPAVIVSVVVIINKDAYGSVSLDSSNSNSTKICYIRDNVVKMVTTAGVFALVFLFNMSMLVMTVKRVVSLKSNKFGSQVGQSQWERMKRDMCTLLWVSTLLGITWGLVFFSFSYLTTPALYAFCILSSLQGFFIFLWFAVSLKKIRNSSAQPSSETRSTNS
ncbi:uncharacterized protein V6R79_015388 [Siganus canaliculatus]